MCLKCQFEKCEPFFAYIIASNSFESSKNASFTLEHWRIRTKSANFENFSDYFLYRLGRVAIHKWKAIIVKILAYDYEISFNY